jgi:geranylgeranyl reductase family protein
VTATAARAERQFDLIVIGAGPAGAAAAHVAASQGLRTALVDKRRFPRPKLCGGGITGRAMSHYRDIFEQNQPDVPLVTCRDLSFFAFGQDLGTDHDAPPLHLGMRITFDAHLVALALRAGAEDFTGQTGALDTDAAALDIASMRLTAPVIIAADGVNSPTARQLFGSAFDRTKIGFALEVETPEIAPDKPLRIDFGAAEWGYGWRFPKTGSTTIGLGGVMSRNTDMKAALAQYLDRLGADPTQPPKGQFLPFGAFRKTPGRGQILLAGDAAGLVDPITGEGIAHALHSGSLAAQATIAALKAGRPETALALYQQKIRPIHRGLQHAGMLRQIIFRPQFRRTFIKSFQNSRTLRGEYLRLLAGQTEYAPIMRHMALRLPGFGLKVLREI